MTKLLTCDDTCEAKQKQQREQREVASQPPRAAQRAGQAARAGKARRKDAKQALSNKSQLRSRNRARPTDLQDEEEANDGMDGRSFCSRAIEGIRGTPREQLIAQGSKVVIWVSLAIVAMLVLRKLLQPAV